ncbi:hypothetical protein ADK57_08540 [Streptomyces sp. MMG1533]|uniref:hypothetical protein n=1 Tax=Streptomyces sp. MMG1533 TaxID=1415546 RepID=UPI0006AE6AD4|nr:hypothetical protein [Streptomyces sp. MMG1533]KOU73680.1 hypothetical protein ADK57_08540 [Streptomyces sp. MMG1533]
MAAEPGATADSLVAVAEPAGGGHADSAVCSGPPQTSGLLREGRLPVAGRATKDVERLVEVTGTAGIFVLVDAVGVATEAPGAVTES